MIRETAAKINKQRFRKRRVTSDGSCNASVRFVHAGRGHIEAQREWFDNIEQGNRQRFFKGVPNRIGRLNAQLIYGLNLKIEELAGFDE